MKSPTRSPSPKKMHDKLISMISKNREEKIKKEKGYIALRK